MVEVPSALHQPSTNLACSANQFDGYRLRNETFHSQLPTCDRLFGLKGSDVSHLSLWHTKSSCWVAAGWENDGFNDKTVPLSHNGLRFLRRETLQNAVLLN